jgi:hypothetical protein
MQTSLSKFAIRLACCLFLLASLHARGATLMYSTYFGGSGYDGANAVAVDSAGNIYVAGATSSVDFPTLNAVQPDAGGGSDGFIAKFSPAGELLFSTYFGGAGDDIVNAIKLDPDGNIVAVGTSHSTDLSTTDNAFQPNYNGGTAFGSGDGFIAKISSDGTQLLYCSYFGGSGDEELYSLAIDFAGNICIAGWTDSSKDLPLKNSLQPKFAGGGAGVQDGFVAKFDATLTNLIFSTYFGGDLRELGQRVAVDSSGFIYLSGMTSSTNFPVTPGSFQTRHGFDPGADANWDGYVAKLEPDGSKLVYFTYIGGPGPDAVYGLAVGPDRGVYLTGTISTTWPIGAFPLGFQPKPASSAPDVWVAKLKPDGSNFEWFSYLGGTGLNEWGLDIVLDKNDNVYIGGLTESLDFPVVDAVQPRLGGSRDSFVAKVSPDGQKLVYSTFLGGSAEDSGAFLALDPDGNLLVVGQTSSKNFPIEGGIQTTNATTVSEQNVDDAYIVRLSSAVIGPPLHVARSGVNVLVSWSTNYPGFILESSASIPASLTWSKVNSNPLIFSDQFVVPQRVGSSSQFFRLRRP